MLWLPIFQNKRLCISDLLHSRIHKQYTVLTTHEWQHFSLHFQDIDPEIHLFDDNLMPKDFMALRFRSKLDFARIAYVYRTIVKQANSRIHDSALYWPSTVSPCCLWTHFLIFFTSVHHNRGMDDTKSGKDLLQMEQYVTTSSFVLQPLLTRAREARFISYFSFSFGLVPETVYRAREWAAFISRPAV